MRIYLIKPYFQKLLVPVKDILISFGFGPTSLNIFGVISAFGMGVSIYYSQSNSGLLLLIPMFAFLRISANALDGMIARDLKQSSLFGEAMNEFLDRISDVIVFGSFLLLSTVNTTLVTLVLVSMLLSSYLGILCKAITGVRLYKGLMCKADRMFYLSVGAIVIYFFDTTSKFASWGVVLFIIFLGLVYTVIERTILIYKMTNK